MATTLYPHIRSKKHKSKKRATAAENFQADLKRDAAVRRGDAVQSKRRKPVKVKKVKLSETAVLHVELPPKVVPLISHNKGIVEIVPLKEEPRKKVTWWETLFGTEKFE